MFGDRKEILVGWESLRIDVMDGMNKVKGFRGKSSYLV